MNARRNINATSGIRKNLPTLGLTLHEKKNLSIKEIELRENLMKQVKVIKIKKDGSYED